MLQKIFKRVLFFSLFFNTVYLVYSQCPDCGSPRTYRATSSTNVNLNGGNWIGGSGNFSAGQIARFSDPRNYIWTANDFNLGGIILRGGASLTLDRPNQGNNPSFTISNNCIVVGNGSTLNLIYITAMQNVTICIEEGGTLVMDSRASSRNDFFLDNVQINLQGPGAQLDFGDADIVIGSGGVRIDGYVGGGCDDPNGNVRSTNPPISGDDVCLLFEISGLPVEYLYFKSTFQPQERAVQLNWATAKEWENSHFEIQRSVNGVRNWEKIGEVKGAGWSEMPVEYFFTDEMLPLTGGNIFYRLKQVDFNGDFAYSEVVSARVPSLQFTNGVWRVFPNPTNGDAFRIELLDTKRYKGEAIQANLITPTAGRKSLLGSNTVSIAEEVLELLHTNGKGVYILEIAWSNKVEHIKILKQ